MRLIATEVWRDEHHRRRIRHYDNGRLDPYPWGPGYYVIPRRGGAVRAWREGLDVAPTLHEAEASLKILEES